MVYLRATKKVLDRLPATPHPQVESASANNALGDWFVTRFVCRRQPYLLLLSSTTRLAILDAAKDVRGLPQRLPLLVEQRLWEMGIGAAQVQQELADMGEVQVAPTNDRSTLGALNLFVAATQFCLEQEEGSPRQLKAIAESFLEEHFSRRGKEYIFPADAVRELLG